MDNTIEINYNYIVSRAVFNTTSTTAVMDSKRRTACSLRQATLGRDDKKYYTMIKEMEERHFKNKCL